MLRAGRIILLSSTVLVAAGGGGQAFTQAAGACADVSSPPVANMDADSKLATAKQPAQVSPQAGPSLLSSSPALQLTLRPTAADPDSPFLAQVYANLCNAKGTGPQLLGTVSFFPLKVGQPQNFVLPAPEHGFPPLATRDVQLTVKLVPANPARTLDNTTVEVVKAQFAK